MIFAQINGYMNNTITKQPITTDQMQPVIEMVTHGLASHTKRSYDRALTDFMVWYQQTEQQQLSKATVAAHVDALKEMGVTASSINQRLSAIRRLALESADNGLITEQTAQAIKRAKGVTVRGRKLGQWLDSEQAAALINSPWVHNQNMIDAGKYANDCKAHRDHAILSLMIGCGVRRSEVCAITIEHLQRRASATSKQVWLITNLKGKHGRVRSIPMAAWCKSRINEWLGCAGIDTGFVFRRVGKGGKVYDQAMSPQAVWDVVTLYSQYIPTYDDDGNKSMGISVSPHDLRRTFARLSRNGGAAMEQIQQSLGHASIKTTEDYIGAQLDLDNNPSDAIELDLS